MTVMLLLLLAAKPFAGLVSLALGIAAGYLALRVDHRVSAVLLLVAAIACLILGGTLFIL